MNEIEKESYKNLIKGMTTEAMKTVVVQIDTDVLWDELRRREREGRNTLQRMKDLVMGK